LKLTCTSDDMVPLAKAVGLQPPVRLWKPEERDQLMAELDAAYFILYGIKREDVAYILSTFRIPGEKRGQLLPPGGTLSRILWQYDELLGKSTGV
jgi:hypothetical protein